MDRSLRGGIAMKSKLLEIYRITPSKPYRRVRMLTLRKGDLFIAFEPESEGGEIVCDLAGSGKFIMKALENPKGKPAPDICGIQMGYIA
jgi:hypothetical protein